NVLSVSLESGSPFAVSLANAFDNSDGTVHLAAGTVSGSVTTEFRMATVTFQTADVSGPTSFQLATSSPRNTLTSISGNPEPTNLVGASISVQRLALVDLRIIPQSVSIQPSQPFSFEIRVEPNGQTLTGAQAFLNFNPKSLQVVSVATGSSSPLSIPLVNRFDNSIGTLDFAAGTLGSGANQDFVLAVVTMSGGASGITTPVEFSTESPRQSTVSVGGDMIQRDLIGMSVTNNNTPGVPNLSLTGMMILTGVFLIALYWASVRRKPIFVHAAR
ncbi:MAG: cohesin domain-containing protein, partial [SAR202 cluster bacterium]|nr:cohesin domain-containing protein [SAR202 cluster bacterium]